MKTRLLPAVLLLAAVLSLTPAPARAVAPHRREQMRRLLDGLPAQNEIARSLELVRQPETAKNPQELRRARQQVRLAQRRIPRILALLHPRASIFDYPGLLAVAEIHYYSHLDDLPDGTPRRGYTLHLGGDGPTYPSSRPPWGFQASIDEKGIIVDVTNLVCRQ